MSAEPGVFTGKEKLRELIGLGPVPYLSSKGYLRNRPCALYHLWTSSLFSYAVAQVVALEDFTIQQVAELTHLSEHTLRYYERLGLLNSIGRDSKGYRKYSRSDLTRIQFLRCLRATGMSIQKMQCYVELLRRGPQTADERRLLLVAHAQEVQEHIAELQQDV